MIFTERTVTVRNGNASIDAPVILYRGDRKVEIRFKIIDAKFKFQSGDNIISSTNASFAQLAILNPNGSNAFAETTATDNGTVLFVITREMIDQLEEVGSYSFHIRLFDEDLESRITLPEVKNGFEVREPIISEDHDNSVNNAIVGYSIINAAGTLNEKVPDTFNSNGDYNKTIWETGDRITEGKLNKIEDAIDTINQNEINDKNTLNKQMTSNFNVLQNQINTLVLESGGDSNLEVVQSRVDYKGSTFSTLKDRTDNIERLIFDKKSLYNNIQFEQGGTGSDGDYSVNNRLRSVGFININGMFEISIDSDWKYNIIKYDNNGVIIKNFGFTSGKTIIDNTKADNFKIVIGKNDNTTITPLSFSIDLLDIEYTPNTGIFKTLNEFDSIKDSFIDEEVEVSKTIDGYYQQDKFDNSINNITYYYEIKNLKSIKLTTTQKQHKNIYTLLDDEFNVLNYIRVNDSKLIYNEKVIDTNGATFIAISELKTSPVYKKISYLKPIIKEDKSKFTNKKFVWFGTSIPAGAKEGKNNPLSYPIQLGGRLGANVINEAIGESSLHCKAIHRISEDNPYGFEENWNKCARCLTNTLDEVEWLIKNYNNTTVFTSGTLSILTDDDKAFYRSCSYENKLLPHLESGDVDLFVLDHGHNDRYNANKKNGLNIDDADIMNEYGEFNLYTFEGASNFIINKILTSNPMNKICFIGEYENQKMDKVWLHQLKVAEKWLFPIYKQWEKLGWSQNKITTTGYWNNSTGLWVESSGDVQEITMLNRWVRDNIHPSSDASGRATKWILDNMEKWFLNNI